jgi:hypothetical protein
MTKLTYQAAVLAHMRKVGSISIREAMDDYGMSGGSLTKYISMLRSAGHVIHKEVRKHPITGRKYARYHLMDVYQPTNGVKAGEMAVVAAGPQYPYNAYAA